MFKLDLPIEPKEAARIARRRAAEEQRRQRVFNPAVRQLGGYYPKPWNRELASLMNDVRWSKPNQKQGRQSCSRWVDSAALKKQIEEKKAREEEEKKLEKAYANEFLRQKRVVAELETRVKEAKLQVVKALVSFNKTLAAEKKAKENQAKVNAALDGQVETEMTANYGSRLGPHRVLRDEFRGYSSAQIAAIKDEQVVQMLEKRQRESDEKKFNDAWDRKNRRDNLLGRIAEHEVVNRRKDVVKKTSDMNQRLAREQTLRQHYNNNHLYKDTPTEEYYAQFNTSTR